jgi:hypothetical protein
MYPSCACLSHVSHITPSFLFYLIRLKGQGSKKETEVLRGYAHKYFGDIVALLGKVPSDLLLVLKTNDCLRHLDRALGAPVNTAIGKIERILALFLWFSVLNRAFYLDVHSYRNGGRRCYF